MEFTVATLNVLHSDTTDQVHDDICLAFDHGADVVGLQENETRATNKAVAHLRRSKEIAGYVPQGPGKEDAILWSTKVFEALPGHGERMTHHGTAKVTPNRYFVWQPLRHKATGKRVLVINTHAVSGYSHAHKSHPALRDADARKHWTECVLLTKEFMKDGYDAIVLTGDFNCRLENRDEPFYPGPMLDHLYVFDDAPHSIDRIVYTKSSGIRFDKRWSVHRGVYSDHDLHLARLTFTSAPATSRKEASMPHGFMPGALNRNIAPGSNDPQIHPVGVVFHVAVSHAKSLRDYFAHRSGGIESHFYVRSDGTIEQYRSIYYEADAQYHGNSFMSGGRRCGFVSVETEGMGPGEWTPAQVESLKRIVLWVHSEAPFPLRKCPGPYAPGVGYHRLFSAWNPNGHSCPGSDRVRQFDRVFVPWLSGAAKGLGHAGSSVSTGRSNVPPRMNPANYYIGAHGPWVRWLGKRLVAHGFDKHHDGNGYQPGPTFTHYDRANVRDFQRAQGWTGSGADGFPGPETLKRLAAKPKPKHKADPKPHGTTRVENARKALDNALAILDRAVANGRHGTVQDVRDEIRRQRNRLPRY